MTIFFLLYRKKSIIENNRTVNLFPVTNMPQDELLDFLICRTSVIFSNIFKFVHGFFRDA